MKKIIKINKNSLLTDIMKKPGAERILAEHGVPCLNCPHAALEMEELRIGEIAKIYRLNINKILGDLNK